MKCDDARELIQLYVDSELDARSTLRVRDHIESCSGCGRMVDAYVRQDALLREGAKREFLPADGVRARILAAIEKDSTGSGQGRLVRALRRPWFKAAAVVLVIAPVVLYFLSGGIGVLPPVATVCAAAASDHADHCSPESGWKAVTNEQELAAIAWSYGLSSGLPDLLEFGFRTPRGRVCKVGDSRYLHIVYYTPDREPLSLFVRSTDSNGNPNIILREQRGYRVVITTGSGRELLVVTSRDDKEASAIAQSVWTHASTPARSSETRAKAGTTGTN